MTTSIYLLTQLSQGTNPVI